MTFVSVTRLRVRSLLYMPAFIWHTFKVIRQAQGSPQFLGGRVLSEKRNAFWTATAWADQSAMLKFRQTGAHKVAMPKLLKWCDEASYVHWTQESREVPNWQEAHRRLV